jgi:hypothetical protein
MGKEALVNARFPDGDDDGKLQWEQPKLIFRGAARRVFEGDALKSVRAEGGDLVVGEARFELGEAQAAKWSEAINNPPGRLDKLGVKPGQRIGILNLPDLEFMAELSKRAAPTTELADLDILFYGADDADELASIGGLVPALAERGALWIVSRKGKAATVKDVEVMAAAKAHGLVDNKVCGFSETHTALRFTRRRS